MHYINIEISKSILAERYNPIDVAAGAHKIDKKGAIEYSGYQIY